MLFDKVTQKKGADMIPVQSVIKAYKATGNITKAPEPKLDIKTEGETYRDKVSKNVKKSFADLLQQKLKP